MRLIASQVEGPIRIVGLCTSLANAKDLGEWIGASSHSLFNFPPGAPLQPLSLCTVMPAAPSSVHPNDDCLVLCLPRRHSNPQAQRRQLGWVRSTGTRCLRRHLPPGAAVLRVFAVTEST